MARKFRETRQSWEFQPPHGIPLARNHNLYSYYPGFDGQARDYLNKNNGTITGTLTRATATVRGKTSLCWALNGSTSVDLGSGSLYLQRPNFSIRLSVKVLSLANSYTALVSTVGSQYLQLFVKSSGKLALYAKNVGTDSYDGTGVHTLVVGRWYDLEVTYDQVSGSGSVWVDKKLDGTFFLGTGNGFSSGMAALTIGRDTVTSGRVLTGHVQNLAFFTSTHTAAQVAEAVDDQWRLFVPRSVLAPINAGGADVATSLSGQAATASAGTLANSRTVAASGQAATASAGTVAPSLTLALSGQAVTASAGTLTQSKAVALSGQAVTASAGTLGETRTVALSGQAATASAGTVTYTADGNVTLALSGQAVAASAGTVAPAATIATSGQVATASAGTAAAGMSIAASGTQITTAAGTLTLGIVVPLAGQAAAAGAGTVTYSTAGAVVVALTGQAVEASAGTMSYAEQILSAAPIGHGPGMSRRSPSKGGSRAPQLSTRTR